MLDGDCVDIMVRDTLGPKMHFPIESAMFCLDCSAIFEIAQACPACGSSLFHPIAQWLKEA